MSCREGFMSPQTETKASVGFKAGVMVVGDLIFSNWIRDFGHC